MRIIQSDGKGGVLLEDGKWYNQFTGKPLYTNKSHKRYRATVVIFNDDRVLLVRDRGRKDFSLLGGDFKKHENTIQAGIREACEELGIKTISAERLRHCDLHGRRANHKVCMIMMDMTHKPYLKSKELEEFIWWDMKSKIPVQGHVIYILKKLEKIT